MTADMIKKIERLIKRDRENIEKHKLLDYESGQRAAFLLVENWVRQGKWRYSNASDRFVG